MPVGKIKLCYICYKLPTTSYLSGVPVCPECMAMHFRDVKKPVEEEELRLTWEGEDTDKWPPLDFSGIGLDNDE